MKSWSSASHCLIQYYHAQNFLMPLRMRRISPRTHILYERRFANRNDKIPGRGKIGQKRRRGAVNKLRDIGFMADNESIILAPCLADQVMSFSIECAGRKELALLTWNLIQVTSN